MHVYNIMISLLYLQKGHALFGDLYNKQSPFAYPHRLESRLWNFSRDVSNYRVNIQWAIDEPSKLINFYVELECPRPDLITWITVGFSDHGDYEDSDVCMFTANDGLVVSTI